MKKTMKWVFGLILTLVMPCALMAETVNVGVDITQIPSIDVVVTLNASLKVEVASKTAWDSYATITNNGTSLASVSITDIEALSEGAPTEFIEYDRNENPLEEANEVETATKIAFGVSLDGETWTTIYPESENKSVDLGVVNGSVDALPEYTYDENKIYDFVQVGNKNYHELFNDGINSNTQKHIAIAVRTGWAWTTEQSLEYAITMVVEGASAPARDEFPSEIFTSGYGSGDFALVGDYALNDEGTNITNTLNDIALRIRLYGDLKINHITADVNNNFTFSGIGGGTLFKEAKMVSANSATDFYLEFLDHESYEDFIGKHISVHVIAENCEDLENTSTGCTTVASWDQLFYIPEV